ncbi:FISUMP domain-containing protein [Bacteroidota bacterium]
MKLKSFSFLPGLVILCSLLIQNSISAQNIAITDDESYTAESSAMLDVKSTSKGMLVPRMDSLQRIGISEPANGLLVYDTDANAFYYFNGTNWLNLTTNVVSPASANVNDALFSVVNANGDTVFAVYPEGIRMNVGDGNSKASKGGFAVGGLASGKLGAVNFMTISSDSARIYVDTATSKGTKGGFAVGGLASGKGILNNYLTVSDDSVRVYIEEGTSKATKGGFAVGGLASGKASAGSFFYVDHDTTAISNVLTAASNIIVGGEIYDETGGFYAPDTTLTDIDGNVYSTVIIGDQTWMAENLRTTRYANGDSLVDGTDVGDLSMNYSTKYYFWYQDSSYYGDTYGALYTYAAFVNYYMESSWENPSGIQGICPDGWHVPGQAEWSQLIEYLEGESVAGGKIKEADTLHWESPNTGATNESGLTILPGGTRWVDGTFSDLGIGAYFWSATISGTWPTSYAYAKSLFYNGTGIAQDEHPKSLGKSVRCVKDEL